MLTRKSLSYVVAAFSLITLAGCRGDRVSSPRALAPDGALTAGYGGPPDGRGGGGGSGGGGGDESAFGNNLSNPVMFAEAVGITGTVIGSATDYANTGLRPLSATETTPFAALQASGLPFFWTGNTPDAAGCYLQKTANTWQPQWALGPGTEIGARVDWGDNLNSQTFSVSSVIRVENTLYDDATTMTGYVMDPACTTNPQSSTEMQGTKGATSAFVPTIFSVTAHLVIEKLDRQGGTPVATVVDKRVADAFTAATEEESGGPGQYTAEINVGGKLVYGYVLNMGRILVGEAKDGWYRITFSLDPSATIPSGTFSRGVKITSLDPSDTRAILPNDYSTSTEFEVKASRGKRGTRGGGGGEG